MRRSSIMVSVALGAALLASAPANAATKTGEECIIDNNVCYGSCKDLGDRCLRDCDKKWAKCDKAASKKKESGPDPLKPKGGDVRTPPTGSAKDEPKAPPKVNDTRAPTGGAKDQPKSPPKVNDTRAPLGGGVFHPKTSGNGTSGPILRSGGAPAPIQKSNGGNGPTFRSTNERR